MNEPGTPATAPAGPGPGRHRALRRAGPRKLGFEGLEGRVVCSGFASPGAWRPLAASEASPLPGPLRAQAVRSQGARMDRLANLTYTNGTTAPQVLDVYRPAGPAPPGGWPVVLAIHGGGWRKFDKDQYAAKVAPALVARGFAVVAPNYTLSTPQSPSWPAPLLELRQAVRWVGATGRALGLDPSRVAAMGESAGGHLALMLGTDPAGPDTRIEAVVDFFGPADLATLRVQSSGARFAIDQLLGPGVADPRTLADASPVSQITADDPPVLILQGTADTLVPPAQSRALAAALSAAHVASTLVLVPGAPHGFGFGASRSILPSVLSFLSRSLRIGR